MEESKEEYEVRRIQISLARQISDSCARLIGKAVKPSEKIQEAIEKYAR